VKGAGYAALAVELANVAQVDEDDVVAIVERTCRLDRQRLDGTFGRCDQRLHVHGDLLRHR
jgi:hypothetical protein